MDSLKWMMWRFYNKVRPFPNDRSLRYWESAARFYPERTICSSVRDEQDFRAKYSLATDSSINFSSDWTVLDLGCGIGRSVPLVSPKVRYYIGVDFSPTMIKKARERNRAYANVSFLYNNGWVIPLEDGSIDCAFCELLFQHLSKENSLAYALEVHRVLKDGAAFLVEVPRLDYFKDDSYAFGRHELDGMFILYSDYAILGFEYSDAYFLVRAVK